MKIIQMVEKIFKKKWSGCQINTCNSIWMNDNVVAENLMWLEMWARIKATFYKIRNKIQNKHKHKKKCIELISFV